MKSTKNYFLSVIHIIDTNYEGAGNYYCAIISTAGNWTWDIRSILCAIYTGCGNIPWCWETVLKGRYYQLIYDVADQFKIREIQQPAAAING